MPLGSSYPNKKKDPWHVIRLGVCCIYRIFGPAVVLTAFAQMFFLVLTFVSAFWAPIIFIHLFILYSIPVIFALLYLKLTLREAGDDFNSCFRLLHIKLTAPNAASDYNSRDFVTAFIIGFSAIFYAWQLLALFLVAGFMMYRTGDYLAAHKALVGELSMPPLSLPALKDVFNFELVFWEFISVFNFDVTFLASEAYTVSLFFHIFAVVFNKIPALCYYCYVGLAKCGAWCREAWAALSKKKNSPTEIPPSVHGARAV